MTQSLFRKSPAADKPIHRSPLPRFIAFVGLVLLVVAGWLVLGVWSLSIEPEAAATTFVFEAPTVAP
ncbi:MULTISPECIES: hypothetical protein [unclassified Microbacterium]|uniref:hypothetical protein n=1 Tax=unclassified Microbacterium TaxID=2609290 RepID=UPI000EA9EB15|nr:MULTISPECIES: hypothetical protein [unclassified Microbacterium]MBT2483976.1 hypothetical protein [Microbacterium sp. ISL-108]RKN66941.1 hypothetical protein D7252_04610 [Microbacterium sp. CGR2]